VLLNSAECFVIAERTPSLLLLCPAPAGPRTRIVSEQDPKLTRSDPVITKPIFDEVTRNHRLEDVP
jgi:hypothetical protein